MSPLGQVTIRMLVMSNEAPDCVFLCVKCVKHYNRSCFLLSSFFRKEFWRNFDIGYLDNKKYLDITIISRKEFRSISLTPAEMSCMRFLYDLKGIIASLHLYTELSLSIYYRYLILAKFVEKL